MTNRGKCPLSGQSWARLANCLRFHHAVLGCLAWDVPFQVSGVARQREKTMKRTRVTENTLTARRLKELSWDVIARKIGGASKIIVTAACMGQMKMTREQATRAGKLFGLGKEEVLLLQEVPYRGLLPQVPPTDPLIYRFYELVQVYGTTWKELIQEEFGDGIMSAMIGRAHV